MFKIGDIITWSKSKNPALSHQWEIISITGKNRADIKNLTLIIPNHPLTKDAGNSLDCILLKSKPNYHPHTNIFK